MSSKAKTQSKSPSAKKDVKEEEETICIIRIRGAHGMNRKILHTLHLLNLYRTNSATLVRTNSSSEIERLRMCTSCAKMSTQYKSCLRISQQRPSPRDALASRTNSTLEVRPGRSDIILLLLDLRVEILSVLLPSTVVILHCFPLLSQYQPRGWLDGWALFVCVYFNAERRGGRGG